MTFLFPGAEPDPFNQKVGKHVHGKNRNIQKNKDSKNRVKELRKDYN
jgi:hypothetical protein